MEAVAWIRGLVVGAVLLAFAWASSGAQAAFPGRDGRLVVQPAGGGGVVLLDPRTGAERTVCADVSLCGRAVSPRVSPDGREIVFTDATTSRLVVVASDGTCLWCLKGQQMMRGFAGAHPAFTADGRSVTFAARGAVWRAALAGVAPGRLLHGSYTDAVSSSRGELAVVSGGQVWLRSSRGRLRRLARGGSPSWSPDGTRLTLVRDGWIWIEPAAGGPGRRLVRGEAAAWSPDGRQVAYIAAGGAIFRTTLDGAHRVRVGLVRARSLDWQPLRVATDRCRRAHGARVIASSPQAIVTRAPAPADTGGGFDDLYGCLRAVGRTVVLYSGLGDIGGGGGADTEARSVSLAGRFAGVVLTVAPHDSEYAPYDTAFVADLGRGQQVPAGQGGQLQLDTSGFSAWLDTQYPPNPYGNLSALSCPSVTYCVAVDTSGGIGTSADPSAGRDAWTFAPVDQFATNGLSCPTASFCVAVGADIITSTNPAGGKASWTATPPNGYPLLQAVSCPSVSLCVAVGESEGLGPTSTAAILSSTTPTGGPSAWKLALPANAPGLSGVSCPTASFCAAVGATDVLTTTDPIGGAGEWMATEIDPAGSLRAISCPTISLCVAVDRQGSVFTSTNPTAGTGSWHAAEIAPGQSLDSVSCPTASLCVAVSSLGELRVSANPTAGSDAWTVIHSGIGTAPTQPYTPPYPLPPQDPGQVACASASLCVAALGPWISTSSNPLGGEAAWHGEFIDGLRCGSTNTCRSQQLFAYDSRGTRLLDEVPVGSPGVLDNLRLSDNSLVLSWTRDGVPRSLALR